MTARPFITLALVISILFFPYWLYLPFVAIAAFLLPFYWEAVILGFLIDALYGSRGSHTTALIALLLVATLLPIRERVRWTFN